MKILKSGKNKSEWEYIATCMECRCEFSFKRGEKCVYEQREGDDLVVPCPECGYKVRVNKNSGV